MCHKFFPDFRVQYTNNLGSFIKLVKIFQIKTLPKITLFNNGFIFMLLLSASIILNYSTPTIVHALQLK